MANCSRGNRTTLAGSAKTPNLALHQTVVYDPFYLTLIGRRC